MEGSGRPVRCPSHVLLHMGGWGRGWRWGTGGGARGRQRAGAGSVVQGLGCSPRAGGRRSRRGGGREGPQGPVCGRRGARELRCARLGEAGEAPARPRPGARRVPELESGRCGCRACAPAPTWRARERTWAPQRTHRGAKLGTNGRSSRRAAATGGGGSRSGDWPERRQPSLVGQAGVSVLGGHLVSRPSSGPLQAWGPERKVREGAWQVGAACG